MKRKLFFQYLCLLFVCVHQNPVEAHAFDDFQRSDDYICSSEQASGFVFQHGRWNATEFNNPGSVYILEFQEVLRTHERIGPTLSSYRIKFPDSNVYADCVKKLDGISCPTVRMTMSVQTMRYNMFYIGRANNSINKKSNSNEVTGQTFIELGSCMVLNGTE